MANIFTHIQNKNIELEKNQFCLWLKNPQNHLNIKDSFSFTPGMLFFIMGFRDILAQLKYENPQNEIEHMINTHCDEDQHHWLWYMHDLKSLGYVEDFEKKGLDYFIRDIWSESNFTTRQLVYTIIHLIEENQNYKLRLVIVECLEATFGVFMNQLKIAFSQHPIYNKLKFFGSIHEISESEHSMGSWIEDSENINNLNAHEEKEHKILADLTQDEFNQSIKIVNIIFNKFDVTFNQWFQYKEFYSSSLQINQQSQLTDFNLR